MKNNQLTKGKNSRILYIENKDGDIDGAGARIGWVIFSKSGQTVYYRGKTLKRAKGGGIRGNHFDDETGEEYWISGIKKRSSNTHWAESTNVIIDEDAIGEYNKIVGV